MKRYKTVMPLEPMKIDPYNHKQRFLKWKAATQQGIQGLSKENSDLIKRFIGDMELGLNVSLNSVARFINMHAAAGVPRENIRAAVVVHGSAGWELLNDAGYRERHGVGNPNAELIRELTAFGARVILCGQTAASRGIPRDQVMSGVEVALSAMTAFLVLQEDGYRVNPW